MPRWGMVIDLDKCTACQSCTAACRAENNVPFAGPEQAALGRGIFYNEVMETEIHGHYPFLVTQFIPRPCMHCEHPPCVKVCPVGATFKNSEGVVLVDYDVCIGCHLCAAGCPYGVRYFNWYQSELPDPLNRALNPDVPVRPKGVVEKCTFCSHRIDRGLEQGFRPGIDREATPACVNICPVNARIFGDHNDIESPIYAFVRDNDTFRLREDFGTEPKVHYVRPEKEDV